MNFIITYKIVTTGHLVMRFVFQPHVCRMYVTCFLHMHFTCTHIHASINVRSTELAVVVLLILVFRIISVQITEDALYIHLGRTCNNFFMEKEAICTFTQCCCVATFLLDNIAELCLCDNDNKLVVTKC